MKHISMIGGQDVRVTSDKAIKAAYELATSHLNALLVNIVKNPSSRPAYYDLTTEFDKYYSIIDFIASNHSFTNKSLAFKRDAFEAFNRQLTVFKNAPEGYEQNNQLIKLCEIANFQLGIRVPKFYLDNLNIEDDSY